MHFMLKYFYLFNYKLFSIYLYFYLDLLSSEDLIILIPWKSNFIGEYFRAYCKCGR